MNLFSPRPGPLRASVVLCALLACSSVHAARPMLVDDATITAEGLCQVESWTQRSAGQNEYWVVPACNGGAGWELSAGVGRIGAVAPDRPGSAALVQAKTVLRPLEPNGWGIGLTLANQLREGADSQTNWSVVVPLSVSLRDDTVQVHANLGVQRGVARHHDRSWGLGVAWDALPRLTLMLEVDRVQQARGVVQAAVRYTVREDRMLVNAAFGRLLGRDDQDSASGSNSGRYLTLGLTFIGPGLF